VARYAKFAENLAANRVAGRPSRCRGFDATVAWTPAGERRPRLRGAEAFPFGSQTFHPTTGLKLTRVSWFGARLGSVKRAASPHASLRAAAPQTFSGSFRCAAGRQVRASVCALFQRLSERPSGVRAPNASPTDALAPSMAHGYVKHFSRHRCHAQSSVPKHQRLVTNASPLDLFQHPVAGAEDVPDAGARAEDGDVGLAVAIEVAGDGHVTGRAPQGLL